MSYEGSESKVPVTFEDAKENICSIKKLIEELSSTLKTLEKSNNAQRPKTKKLEKMRKVNCELAHFMRLSQPMTSRENVLRFISRYVKDNKMQVETNKCEFIIDDALSKLLGLAAGSKLTFLGINKHISHLFISV